MDSRREALEAAMRRTLAFHLGTDGAGADQERELLVSAFLDAAETGALHDTTAVGREFNDYLPDATLSPPVQQELYDDILRQGHPCSYNDTVTRPRFQRVYKTCDRLHAEGGVESMFLRSEYGRL